MQTEDVQAYATEQGLLFNEISAKNDIGVRGHHVTCRPPSSRQLGVNMQDACVVQVADVFLGLAKALPKNTPAADSSKLIIGGKLEGEDSDAGCC